VTLIPRFQQLVLVRVDPVCFNTKFLPSGWVLDGWVGGRKLQWLLGNFSLDAG
jgi:hypothetical protein